MKTIIAVLCLILLYYFVLPALKNKMAFHPPELSVDYPQNTIDIKVSPKVNLKAVYLENKNSPYTVLFSHGNAQDISTVQETMDLLHDSGLSVLCYDYRGYGKSSGTPDTTNLAPDVLKVIDFMQTQLNIPARKIIVWGHSLGSVPSIAAASSRKVAALVCQSGFSAAHTLVGLPLDIVPELNNLRKFPSIKCPAVFIHGKLDRVIPFEHGQALHENYKGPKAKIWVDSAGHNDIPAQTYRQAVTAALEMVKQGQ